MGLNARSKRLIQQGAEHLKNVIASRGALSNEGAKDVLRQRRIYRTVKDVTLERIGNHGTEQEWYAYEKARGFWQIGDTAPVGYIRDHVERWALETAGDSKKKRGAIRDRVARVLLDFEDPLIDTDAVILAQTLNERTRSGTFDDDDLGSYRSFVVWGLENGTLKGDLRLMVPSQELIDYGLRRGLAVAKIQSNSMTNTLGEWLWNVNHADGRTSQDWYTVVGMSKHMEVLAAEQVDDEEIDLRALLGPEVDSVVARPNMYDELEALEVLFQEGLDRLSALRARGSEAVSTEI